MSAESLRAGFSVVDITPPTGLYMCGSLDPRTNQGTLDPLQIRTMVVESEGKKIAIVGADIISFAREYVDPLLDEITTQTGIAPEAILVSCSHTHNGPYTQDRDYAFSVINRDYLDSVAAKLVRSVIDANNVLQPATVSIGRSLVHHGQHHRRVLNKKDSKAINTWMPAALNDLDVTPQILGSTGPIDPELWVLRFDDRQGNPIGLFFNYSVHANSRGTLLWSADYPGVVAAKAREAFGDHVVTVYTPGACGDVNPTRGSGDDAWQAVADVIASQAVDAAQRGQPLPSPVAINYARREVTVPRRDPATQPPEAIERLNWGGQGGRSDFFGPKLDIVASMPPTRTVPVSALHIGPFAIATNPGELFVEYGLQIKANSPFPHTVVAELTNDSVMYEPTRRAFEQQGYETLVGSNLISPDGIDTIVQTASSLLEELWQAAQK
jgi:hypothetical protein